MVLVSLPSFGAPEGPTGRTRRKTARPPGWEIIG
jgi:hypothetical protein